MTAHKFICDPDVAEAALNARAERHEQLMIYIGKGIKSAIDANNRHLVRLGETASSPVEIDMALAHVIRDRIGYGGRGCGPTNENEIEKFIDFLRLLMRPVADAYGDYLPWL